VKNDASLTAAFIAPQNFYSKQKAMFVPPLAIMSVILPTSVGFQQQEVLSIQKYTQ
jgi:hypothetical protein